MDNKIEKILLEGSHFLNLDLNNSQIKDLIKYHSMIHEANLQWNLTGFKTEEEILINLILDSLSLAMAGFHFIPSETIIDIGTGAGIPGIPLKIVSPFLHLTLIDSSHKKTGFLQLVVDELHLFHTAVVCERAELLGHVASFRENFDWCVVRALSSLATNLELTIPFLKVGRKAIFIKGPSASDEIERAQGALSILNCQVLMTLHLPVPFCERINQVIVVNKSGHTPDKFPRKNGIPQKNPLE
ncbi:MAG: 16S rRNA (guanine(527)-N(7))-methyltransferase RsmG [Candidatus Atribacteria bacterium]|nr:16S rRNA (guanine(527)-N(7))-methyltransferase RsmG [Candidatus Atribacteria bacterium]